MDNDRSYEIRRHAQPRVDVLIRAARLFGLLAVIPFLVLSVAYVSLEVIQALPPTLFAILEPLAMILLLAFQAALFGILLQVPAALGVVGLSIALLTQRDDPLNASARFEAMALNSFAIGAQLIAMWWIVRNPLWT
jgi:hypothetical protein